MKKIKRILASFLAFVLMLTLLPAAALADDTESAAAPAPVISSDLSDKTYYSDDTKVSALTVRLTKNTANYTKDTLVLEWQSSDDGETFTAIEGAPTAFMNVLLISSYTPEKPSLGTAKYYRVKITNNGLTEGMTPTTIYSAVAKIEYVNAEKPGMVVDKPVIRQEDGTFAEDEGLTMTFAAPSKALPYKDTTIGGFYSSVVMLKGESWDTDKYAFRGWQIRDEFYDGTASYEESVKITPTDDNGWKEYLPGDSWCFNLYYSDGYYRVSYGGQASTVQQVFHVTPVFEKKPDMAYAITLEQSEGGTISQVRGEGESHTLTAVPDSMFCFVRWEKSVAGGDWEAIDGSATAEVTLTADTSYRAVFEPYAINEMEVAQYALPSEGDSWFLNTALTFNAALAETTSITLKIYDGETADEDKLLGEETKTVNAGNSQVTVRASATKRPSSDAGKILVTAELSNGKSAQASYTLKGTLDITPASTSINTFDAIFMETIPSELQLSASGNPAVKSVTWSGGDEKLSTSTGSSVINKNTGLVTFTQYYSQMTIGYTADAGDGRIAEALVTFQSGGPGAKLAEKNLSVPEGESREYTSVNSTYNLSVSRQNVTVKSSDESVFTTEIITKAGSNSWDPTDIVDKIKINGLSKGTGTLTIDVNGTAWSCPVVITSEDDAVTAVKLSQETAELPVGESLTLTADYTPVTAAVTVEWSSSDDGVATVENGVVTAQSTGSAVITAAVTDAKGNTVKASCEVTVEEVPYTVELYVPKNTVGEDGLHLYPAAGFDADGRDTYDAAGELAAVEKDSETNLNYDIYTYSLQKGVYSFRAESADGKSLGGGALSVPDSEVGSVSGRTFQVYLRLAEVYLTNEFDGEKAEAGDFSVLLENKTGAVTFGEPYANGSGYNCYPALVCANGSSLSYYTAVMPSEACIAAHNAMAYVKQDIAVSTEPGVFSLGVELAVGCFTINAPQGAEVAVCENLSDGVVKQHSWDAMEKLEDGTADYRFHLQITGDMFYEVSGAEYVSYKGTVALNSTERIVVSEEMLKPEGKSKTTVDRDYTSNGGANMGDLYLNINAQGSLKLESGDTFQVYARRNWWGSNVTWVLADAYWLIEPDYHYTVVDLNGNASDSVVTVSDGGLLQAVGEGTAVVLVTYDSMTLNYHDAVKVSYEGYDPNGFFGSIWPEDTGVFVVSVGAGDSGITTGMTLNEGMNDGRSKDAGDALDSELDPIYFLGEKGEYTFIPGTEGVTVSVANPAIQGGVLSFSGFTALTANEDGSYTVPLTNGRNLVKVEKDGAAEYQVITAKQITATVNGQSLEDVVVAPGEEVSVVFDTIFNPVTRMRYYNTDAGVVYTEISGLEGQKAGNGRGTYGYYFFGSTTAKQTVKNFITEGNDGSEYANPTVTLGDALAVPEDFDQEYFVLSGGVFSVAGFGGNYGAHRTGYTQSGLAPSTRAYMGQLPDISIPVGTLEAIEVTTAPAKTEYNIGETFDPAGMAVTATYKSSNGSLTREVTGFTYDTAAFTEAGSQKVTVSYTQGEVTKTFDVEVTVKDVKLEKLEVTKLPDKTIYNAGEAFDPTGMVVTAVYSDGSSKEVTGYTCSPETITAGVSEVVVSYNGLTATVPVKLNLVTSIAVTTLPDKVAYTEGDLFNPAGMVVTATYADGTTKATDAYSYAPMRRMEVGDTEITISYTGSDGAETLQPVKINITVTEDTTGKGDYIIAYVSYSEEGTFVTGDEGTLLCYAPVKVYDRDGLGGYNMGDAFAALHDQYYSGGSDGYQDSASGWISKFWGVTTGNVSYTLNHNWVFGTMTEIEEGDLLDLYLYKDLTYYSDLYTWFDSREYSADANTEYTFTVNGLNLMNSSDELAATAYPSGATVTVYDENGAVVEGLTAVTDVNGQFKLTFTEDGIYTIEVNGICDYTCTGYGGSAGATYTDSTVVPSRCTVTVGDVVETLPGDLNGDGQITNTDVAQLLEKVTAGEAVELTLGDLNGDGQVTNADVVQLLNMATAGQ